MWKQFHVGLGPQPMQFHTICSLTVLIQGICQQLPKLCDSNYGGSGMMVDPSAHSLQMNIHKHIVYVSSGFGNYFMWV